MKPSLGATLLQGPSEESAVNGWKGKRMGGNGGNTISDELELDTAWDVSMATITSTTGGKYPKVY